MIKSDSMSHFTTNNIANAVSPINKNKLSKLENALDSNGTPKKKVFSDFGMHSGKRLP